MVRTTSKALACRTTLFLTVLATAAVVSVSSEFFFRPIKPLIFVQKPNAAPQVLTRSSNRPNFGSGSDEHEQQQQQQQLNSRQPPAQGRSDLVSSSEEEQGDESSAEYDDKPNGNRTQLPASFEEDVRRNRPAVEPGRRGPLYGDPAVMEEDTEEQDRSRYLWPFSTSITVSKTKNHPRPHHHGHGHLSFEEEFADFLEPEQATPRPPHPHHDFDPDQDPEVEKLRIEIYRQKQRAKKWKKILKHELAEVGAQVVVKAIDFLEFI